MRIAAYPFASCGKIEENLTRIRQGAALAAAAGARLVCFHECALTGYPPIETPISAISEEATAAGVEKVRRIAADCGVCLLFGTAWYENGKRYNSVLVIDERGGVICRYDKRALWGWDAENFTPGASEGLFELDGLRIGIRVCFDVRFPELFRPLFERRADLCVMPFSDTAETFDPERRAILTGHMRTRAAENVMQVLSVNSLSRFPAVPTAWFDQNGKLVKQTDREELLVCDVIAPKEDFGMRGRRVNAEIFLKMRDVHG